MGFHQTLRQQLHAQLEQIVQTLELTPSPSTQEKIIHYLELLSHWNRAYNLTAIVEPKEMMCKHIADSLTVAPLLKTEVAKQNRRLRFLDVGSGAGLPGIPLALLLPEIHWTLLDSNGKKTRFLQQVRAELQLQSVEVVQSRVEDFSSAEGFDGIIARAWTSLSEMVAKTRHLYALGAKLWAMKGLCPEQELQELALPYQVQRLHVPGLSDVRHVIIIGKTS